MKHYLIVGTLFLLLVVGFLFLFFTKANNTNQSQNPKLETRITQLEIARNIDLAFWSSNKLLERVGVIDNDVYVAITHSNMPKNKLVGADFEKTVSKIEEEVKRVLTDSVNIHVYFCAKDRIPVFYSNGAWSAASYDHIKNNFNR